MYAKSISSLTTLFRHFLIALGEPSSSEPVRLFRRIAELTGADAAAFALGRELRDNHPVSEITRAYGKYLEAIETVIHALDALVPKHEWQRVKKQSF